MGVLEERFEGPLPSDTLLGALIHLNGRLRGFVLEVESATGEIANYRDRRTDRLLAALNDAVNPELSNSLARLEREANRCLREIQEQRRKGS